MAQGAHVLRDSRPLYCFFFFFTRKAYAIFPRREISASARTTASLAGLSGWPPSGHARMCEAQYSASLGCYLVSRSTGLSFTAGATYSARPFSLSAAQERQRRLKEGGEVGTAAVEWDEWVRSVLVVRSEVVLLLALVLRRTPVCATRFRKYSTFIPV